MSLTSSWSFPTEFRLGPGRIGELAEACRKLGMSRPLLVADPGLAGSAMVVAGLEQCAGAGLDCAVFADVKPNPIGANIEAGVAAFRRGGHDGVIAWGGGSSLDAGKLIAFMAGQSRPIWDFEDIGTYWQRADGAAIAPIVAVPTTAGTGSEVGRAGVVTDEATQTKKVIFHPKMLPGMVLADPALTVGLPPHLTAGTGMDAFAHCLEAYCAPAYHPMCEGIAVEGMRLVTQYLVAAHEDGTDLTTRGHMMSAAAMGAVAFQKGLGGIHALSHPIGALYDTHHGLTNAVLMPYVLTFNRPALRPKLDRLAAWLSLDRPGFEGILALVLDLRERLNIPHTIAELGVDPARFARMAAMAVVDPTAAGNPVPLTESAAHDLYRAAYDGDVDGGARAGPSRPTTERPKPRRR